MISMLNIYPVKMYSVCLNQRVVKTINVQNKNGILFEV